MAKRRKAKSFVSNDIESYLHETDKRKNAVPENPKELWRKVG